MMVNNSININKTNNHLWPQNHYAQWRPGRVTLQIQVLAWVRHKHSNGDISGIVDHHCW